MLKRAMQYAIEDQLELAYEALLDFSREYDEIRFSEFRARNCKIESEEIERFDALACSTLVVAISRQMYWDEPPVCSINGKLVEFPPSRFEYEIQIRALVERLKVLHP